ncbi:hypothetical protein quinque_007679 [Culex quinquefasciatus]
MSSTASSEPPSTKAAVLKFLDDQQRPFSLADICEKVKDLGKSSVAKALDSLVGRGKVIEKVYGKQKIYCIAQQKKEDPAGPTSDEVIRKLDADCGRLKEEFGQKQQAIRALEAELATLASQMTEEQARREIEQLRVSIRTCQDQLEGARKDREDDEDDAVDSNLDPVEVEARHNRYLTAYRKRKRICTELIGHIMEGYPKTKRHLLEDIGIETDEEAGFGVDSV